MVITPQSVYAEVAPDGTFMIDQSVGVLEAGEAGAHGAWGLFCQFLLLDSFTAGPPFKQAAAATLAPLMVLRGQCSHSILPQKMWVITLLRMQAQFHGAESAGQLPRTYIPLYMAQVSLLRFPTSPKLTQGRSKCIMFWFWSPVVPFGASIQCKTKYLIRYDTSCIGVVDALVDV